MSSMTSLKIYLNMEKTVFNKLLFNEDKEIMDFVDGMSFNEAISILLMSVGYAHDRGVYNFNEAKLIDKALHVIKDPKYHKGGKYDEPSKFIDEDAVRKAKAAVPYITVDVKGKKFQERLISAKILQTGIFKRGANYMMMNGKILRMMLKLDHVTKVGDAAFYKNDVEIIHDDTITEDCILIYFNGKHVLTVNLIL